VSRKRHHAASETDTTITPQSSLSSLSVSNKSSRNHNVGCGTPHSKAVQAVAASIESLTAALTDVASTPKRHKTAIALLEEDDELSDHESMQVLHLLSKDMSVVGTFLGISTKERCRNFVRLMMEQD
jgi:hypothetical protein